LNQDKEISIKSPSKHYIQDTSQDLIK